MDDPQTPKAAPYLQNRELSWLAFNERVLDQGADETVPLLERLNFISIFWSNLQEFFMVRVGSRTDLALVKKHIIDSKSGMTPSEQLAAIYGHCRELYPIYERTYETLRGLLQKAGENVFKRRRPPSKPRGGRSLLYRNLMCTSRSCCSETGPGAPSSRSCALAFIGKAMTSRMLSSPVSSITIRSMPGAMPACGGAPYLNALYKAENLAFRSSSV